MSRAVLRRRVTRVRWGSEPADAPGPSRSTREDVLAVEEPLEIRIGGRSWSVTMRTPGDDFDLVAGFLVSEGVVAAAPELASLRYCAGVTETGERAENTYNVVDAVLGPGAIPPRDAHARHSTTTSACGVCGTTSIDAVTKEARFELDADGDAALVDAGLLASLPDRLRAQQRLFDSTGGVHAAGLFTAEGELLCLREDVGRHNAVDKVVGWALREGRLPLSGTVLQVSGRASFELVQKARLAGIPVLAAVSAPSSLAQQLAERSGLTLVGFSRGTSFTVYAHPERIRLVE
ncbi:formate dehydrogenase accessory sulfurtransferase FdhD [Agromyces seonyuensis]|uniref:Sulfur carrier protein FdhD n=1 Tax=Agromyces seonyuensis TaxID=2662446 RepID=A0A6I4P1D0_9MICO|nr:formate dehydrogenase accessory sulfurtransferase FdhD [Agromyces seonyuensis]MWB98535.1 formate dehydrogenase accessory sulfurtransferase FdhD [Agromyces seonyuensis]